MKAAFNMDYEQLVVDTATRLSLNMDETINCAGDLALRAMADRDETSVAVFMALSEIYMERGSFLRSEGEKMPKSAKKWMEI